MTRFRLWVLVSMLLGIAAFSLNLNGCGGSANRLQLRSPLIQHIVVIFQENRTPDNLFQGLCSANNGVPGCGTNPGQYDIVSSGVNSQGPIPLTPLDLGTTPTNGNPDNNDLSHGHKAFLEMCDLERIRGLRDGRRCLDSARVRSGAHQLLAHKSAVQICISE